MLEIKHTFLRVFPEKEGWKFEDFGDQFSISKDQESFAVAMHCTNYGFVSVDFFNFRKKDVKNFAFELNEPNLPARLRELKADVMKFIVSVTT